MDAAVAEVTKEENKVPFSFMLTVVIYVLMTVLNFGVGVLAIAGVGVLAIAVWLFIFPPRLAMMPELFFPMLTIAMSIFMILYSIFMAVVTYYLWKRNRTARHVAIINSVIFAILGFPLGTVMHGVVLYSLLLDKDTKALFGE